jgi:uncharacterized protein (TIGR02246 family)
MRIRCTFATFAAAGALWGAALSAVADPAEDEAAIRKAVESYVAAFNKGDGKALASLWSPEAVYVNRFTGEQVTGRDAIEQQFASIFNDTKGAKLEASTDSIQFISPGVAVEHGTAKVAVPDQEPEESEYSAIYVKRDGEWLLDRVTEEDVLTAQSNYEHLKELEWLIGTWVDEDDENRIETTYQWTKNQNFITCFFTVSVRDRVDMAGLQIIGWDPAAERVRSWVYDSGGGFGEGTWTKNGHRWYVQTAGTLPDGSKSSSTNVIAYVDGKAYTWQSLDRYAGDELLPNVAEVVVVRKPDQE